MPQAADDDDDAALFRPVWDTEDELEPPGKPPSRASQATKLPNFTHPLLSPLAQAQDAVARLEARLHAATDAVAYGLRARIAYHEAAGWLAYSHVWIHPWDLALRDAGATGAFYPAMFTGHLSAQLPTTTAQGFEFQVAPSDVTVNRALRFARLWRRLAEMNTWKPLNTATDLHEVLHDLAAEPVPARDIDEWRSSEILAEQ